MCIRSTKFQLTDSHIWRPKELFSIYTLLQLIFPLVVFTTLFFQDNDIMKPIDDRNASTRQSFITCSSCELSFLKNHAADHKKYCGDSTKVNHPTLSSKRGILYVLVDGNHKIPAELKSLNNSLFTSGVVFLHPDLMISGKISFGDCLRLENKLEKLGDLFVVYPSSALKSQFHAGFSRNINTSTKELIKFRKTLHIEASNITLECDRLKTFYETPRFLEYVKNYLLDAFVLHASSIEVPYFGQVCRFYCKKISSDQKVNSKSDELESLVENLSINDSYLNDSKELNQSILLESTFLDHTFIVEDFIVYKIVKSTSLEIERKNATSLLKSSRNFKNLGGLMVAKKFLKEHVILPLELSPLPRNWKTRSFLFYGPNGCGKTLLVESLCSEIGFSILKYDSADDENEDFVEKFSRSFRTIAFFDDMLRDKETCKKIAQKIVKSIDICQTCIDDLLFVIVTSKSNEDPIFEQFLRRRFDFELEISSPNVPERREILRHILNAEFVANVDDAEIAKIAEKTHGFTSADLAILCKEAGCLAAKKRLEFAQDVDKITIQELNEAFGRVKPSNMRQIYTEVPKVFWNDIGGQQELKEQLRQAIEWPLKHAEAFERLGISPPKGVLMYGPPGCSKTMVAKAIATESGLNFLSIKGPELFSKWVGESERAVREVFSKARQVAPSIIFFDEIDALGSHRSEGSEKSGGSSVADRVLTQILTEMDGIQSLNNVLIVAATNRPDVIDRALLRPGRLDRMVYVPLPDIETRKAILQIRFRHTPVDVDVDLEFLATETKGYSGAELVALCTEAALSAMQESIECRRVANNHFLTALKKVKPRTDVKCLKIYDNFHKSLLD